MTKQNQNPDQQGQNPGQQNQNPGQKPGQQRAAARSPASSNRTRARGRTRTSGQVISADLPGESSGERRNVPPQGGTFFLRHRLLAANQNVENNPMYR